MTGRSAALAQHAVILIVTAVLLAACSESSSPSDESAQSDAEDEAAAEETVSLTVAPASPSLVSQAYYYIANYLGFWEQENLEVEVISQFEGGQPEVAMIEGELDIVAGSPTTFFERLAQDPDNQMICTATVGLWPFRVMVEDDSVLQEAGDLAGTTVGVPEVSDVATLAYMLRTADVDPESVESPAVGGRAPAAIEMDADRIDAFMGTHVDQLAIETVGELAVRVIETVPAASTFNTCMLTMADTLESQPDVVERFLRGLAKGFAIQNEDPELAVEILGQAREEAYDSEEDALALMQATNDVNGGAYDERWEYPVEEWQSMVDSFVEADSLSQSFDIGPNIDFSLLDSVWDFDVEEVLEEARRASG